MSLLPAFDQFLDMAGGEIMKHDAHFERKELKQSRQTALKRRTADALRYTKIC